MKKILLGVFIFILIISCGENPETVVSKFIDNVKEKKFDEASKYSVNKDFTKDIVCTDAIFAPFLVRISLTKSTFEGLALTISGKNLSLEKF